jgi:hypothetical protein
VQEDIDFAYKNFKPTFALTMDESAAITLYTSQSIFRHLNRALRTKDLTTIQPWFAYLKIFHTAIQKLPSINKTYCRGEKSDWIESYSIGSILTWVNYFVTFLDYFYNSDEY